MRYIKIIILLLISNSLFGQTDLLPGGVKGRDAGSDSTFSKLDGTYLGKRRIDNIYRFGTTGFRTSDTIGVLNIAPIQLSKVGIYTKLDGAGNRIYSRVKNPSAGWNNAGYFDWWEMAINNGSGANGRGNFSPAPTDTLPNVVWRRGMRFDQAPAMYESDESNWWGSGFLGLNQTSPRNVFEKHWQVADSSGYEHRPLTGYFEKRTNGYGSLGINVDLLAMLDWKYGQNGIITLNRNSEIRYGQVSFFKDSLRTLNLSDLSKNSVLHLASANRGVPDPNGRATFLTIGGNGSFGNVIGLGALYTNTNNGGDLDMVFTTQTGSTQVRRAVLTGGRTAFGVGVTNPLQMLDIGGTSLFRGGSRINMVGDSAAQILKYSNSQTTPIWKVQNNAGSDLFFAHSYNTTNPSLVFGKITSVAATSANNTVFGLTNATFTSGNSNTTLIGTNTGGSSYNGYENTYIGSQAGRNTTDGYQNFLGGYLAGSSLTTGYQNMFLGKSAGAGCTSCAISVAIGALALGNGTTYVANVAVGSQAGQANNGDTNTFIGFGSGRTNIGSGNTFLGASVGELTTSVSNQLWIDNSNTSTPLLKGDFSNDSLRIFGQLKAGLESSANTLSILDLVNTSGRSKLFRTSATPESAITGNPGDLAISNISSAGGLWLKKTGTGNTGWFNLGSLVTESTSIGAFQSSGNSNGLTLSGTDIRLHAATVSTPGGVNVGLQTFGVGADTKVFNGTGSGQITVDGNTDNTPAGINFTQQGTDLMGIVHINSADADNAQLRLALEQDGGLTDQVTIGTLNDSRGFYSRNGLYEDVIAVTTSPYTVQYGDRNLYLDGVSITVNLQAIGTSAGETKVGRVIYFFNDNATNVTITPNGSETINDSASLTLLPNTGVTLLAVTGTKWVTRD